MLFSIISAIPTVALAAILVFVIVDDLRNFRVRNEAIAILAVLFVVHAVVRGQYREELGHVAIAALMFVLILVFYARGFMGGGDAKLLGMAFLWVDGSQWTKFAVLLAIFTLFYVIAARLNELPTRGAPFKRAMPFAPCIAGAWLTTLFL